MGEADKSLVVETTHIEEERCRTALNLVAAVAVAAHIAGQGPAVKQLAEASLVVPADQPAVQPDSGMRTQPPVLAKPLFYVSSQPSSAL